MKNMKISFQLPKENPIKFFFQFVVILFFVLSCSVLEKLSRSSMDIYKAKNICGNISNYYFSKPSRSYATWRLKINTEIGDTKIFEVGDTYIQKKIQKNLMTKGREVCIDYLTIDYFFSENFVMQIYLQGNELLNKNEVINNYLKKPSNMEFYLIALLFMLTLFLVIKIKRN